MEIEPLDQQIRELAAELLAAKTDSDILRLGVQLRWLLRKHEIYVRRMAASIAARVKDVPPRDEAA